MRRMLALVALAASGCASWSGLVPGPTQKGIAVSVKAHEGTAARREAVESLLPLFVSDAARRANAAALEPVLAKPGAAILRARTPKLGASVVEADVDLLSAALRKTGAVVPPGYETGSEFLLIAFGDRATGPDRVEQFAADAFETALFGRGIQAKDADDTLSPIQPKLTGRTEEEAVASAARGAWSWLAGGRAETYAVREPVTGGWKGGARLRVNLYSLGASTEPTRIETASDAIDVSSGAAVTRSLEQAAQMAAVRVDEQIGAARGGKATLAVLVSGRRDPVFLKRLIGDLRRAPGIAGAALVSWSAVESMPLIHAYSTGTKVDALAAQLLHADPSLHIDGIETEDGRLTVEGPEVPLSEDRGGE